MLRLSSTSSLYLHPLSHFLHIGFPLDYQFMGTSFGTVSSRIYEGDLLYNIIFRERGKKERDLVIRFRLKFQVVV
jgi:hypothetical protein